MKKTLYIFLISAFVLSVSSCEDDEEIGGTAVEAMAGEWWVQADGLEQYGYFKFMTYNTADNSATEMWIDDVETFWPMKGKISVNLADKTFSGNNIQSEYGDITFNISDGKIIENAATTSGTGYEADSIYFEAEFSDEPGEVYILGGYRRTGFPEDDH